MKSRLSEFPSADETRDIEFREICGFTFVFMKNILILGDRFTSAEIRPIAIIYEENDEFYLAPLDEAVDINEIIKKYVEDFLKK